MSLHCALLERSMSSSKIATTGYRPRILAILYPLLPTAGPDFPRSRRHDVHCIRRHSSAGSVLQMDNYFINALAKASTCSQHASSAYPQASLPKSFFTYHKPRRRYQSGTSPNAQNFHESPALAGRPYAQHNISREDYKHMVDYYREPYTTQAALREIEPPGLVLPLPAVEKDQKVTEKPVHENSVQPEEPISETSTYSHEWQNAFETLVRALNNESATQKDVFDAYSALPFPGVSHLQEEIRRLLLRRLSLVEKKSQRSSMRFLSVIDDMKAADLPINEDAWNSAIAFTGRCFVRVTAVEVEAAIRMWKEMEQEAGVKSGKVTFNVLFDIATKAGKFVLAEMILQEMANRRLPLNRFARTGLIYYYGLKGDGQGVRRAYREFVDAGHIVDTVVMDCVVVSLLKAGELPAAEQVYERMKQMFARITGAKVPSGDWKETRDLGRVLDRAERVWKSDPHKRQQLQDEQLLAPGLRTYSILIEHHVCVTGELRRITRLLDEMQSLGLPIHGKIFLRLFKGFAYHGGIRYTSWTKVRLESVWAAFGSIMDSQVENVQLQKWMVVWITRAFSKCCGQGRTLEVWAEMKTRWKPDVEDFDSVHHLLRDILRAPRAPQYEYET